MKCPRCGYLGFETGDRCRHCQYDFSLFEPDVQPSAPVQAEIDPLDLPLHPGERGTPTPGTALYLRALDASLPASDEPVPAEVPAARVQGGSAPGGRSRVGTPTGEARGLPLGAADDDTPLVKVPLKPRAPLAVRRTPERPRLRTPAPAPPAPDAPALDLVGEAEEPAVVAPMPDGAVMASPGPSGGLAGRRAAAAVLDHGLLLAIDLVVVYFTLRIAGIEVDQARALPVVPLVTFLVLVKLAYFAVFTACGGQTIGKMAQGIQVVTTDLRSPEMSLGVMRSTAAVASVLSLGLAYLPALVAGDGRAVHDRLAGTRVVSVRP